MIKTIIVDDEPQAVRLLADYTLKCSDLKLLDTFSNPIEAFHFLTNESVDLIFLDIQMPGINGFEVIASLPKPRPYVIFVTAHDQYAIKAFEINAIDYLLKPFGDERFDQAVNKAIDVLKKDQLQRSRSLDSLINLTKESIKGPTKILSGTNEEDTLIFKSDGQIHRVPFQEISHVEAFDYYIKIHVGDKFFLIRETMKKMALRLPQEVFIRIHKSFIVNIKKVTQFGKAEGDNYQVLLNNGERLRVSRSYKNAIQEALT